jgi:hypothetical protein
MFKGKHKAMADPKIMPLPHRMATTAPITTPSFLVIARIAFILFIGSEVAFGPLRSLFFLTGMGLLFYIPKLSIVGLPFFYILLTRKLTYIFVIFIILMIYSAVRGYYVFGNYQQVLFGFYVFSPFVFGLYFGQSLLSPSVIAWLRALWLLAVIGVTLNLFVDFPWSSLELNIFGKQVVATKIWQAGDYSRLSGFSNASYSVSTQVLALGGLLMCAENKKRAWLYFLVSAFVIFVTTQKSSILSFIIFAGFFLWRSGLAYSAASILLGVLNVVPPLIAYFRYAEGNGIVAPDNTRFETGFFNVHTMFERAQWMWPMSLDFINGHGGWIFGAGLGGIGTPMAYFAREEVLFASADSFFVYLLGIFGLGSLVILFGICLVSSRTKWTSGALLFSKLMIAATLAFGVSQSPVERGTFFMFFGIALATSLRAFFSRSAARKSANMHSSRLQLG